MVAMRLALFVITPALGAAAILTPPPALSPDGMPPIAADILQQAAPYNESRTASLEAWHPSRREILISTRFGDVTQIHRVTQPGGARTQVTFFPERVSGARYNPATGHSFTFTMDAGGAEFYQIYLFDTRGGRAHLLTDGKSRNTGARWSLDGRWIAYTSTRRNGKDGDVYVVNPAEPASARLLLQVDAPGWSVSAWSPEGKALIVQRTRSAYEAALYEVKLSDGARRAVTPELPGVAFANAVYARDGKGIYLTTNRDSEFSRLAYLDLATGNIAVLRPAIPWDVTSVALSKDGRRLAYVTNEDGRSVLRVLDTSTRQDLKLPALPQGVMGAVRWHANGRELGFTLQSARTPSDVYSVDVDSGKLERWTFSETGGLNPENFVEPELARWKSFDGRMISGWYYKPPARFRGSRPVIINIHGGPEGQSRPGFRARDNYYLNELGVALVYPNVRGSQGYGKAFLNLDNGYKREDSVKDIGALLDWIAARPDLDARRVMVTGGSYGGYMTLACMTHYNDRLRGGVESVGISNWVTFLNNTQAYRRDLRRVEYGDERDPKMRDFLLTVSPLNRVKNIGKPMFIIQGKNDPRVPWTESRQMVDAIRRNGGPVWFLLAADEGHGFAKKRNQEYQFAATIVFIKEHLLR